MTVSGHRPNQLLQLLDGADFNLLRPYLLRLKWSANLSWARSALRRDMSTSRIVLSEGQTMEIAMLGRDSVADGAVA
ncbi:hypothetical protein [Bradyrhizobium yuanmingense]|uniref:hypothetical protein n=1 Tax=Bradyrhizobium yuanmingense TaxID=108015 RepID=UPI0023B99735|nr:hypothetical protein [Bradyrhizobium yuanmingense]MDF0584803.1 hypothetical protein [Bradyrhizobium yuanmingense]